MKPSVILLLLIIFASGSHALVGFGESNIFSINDLSTPVELSSFTAAVTAQSFVSLQWTSQTETGLFGYRVYRNEDADLAGALLLTPVCIAATNTSQPHSYAYEDREVDPGATYNYWLESLDSQGSVFYGPATVTLDGSSTPPLPAATLLKLLYPNPFRQSAHLEIDVRDGEEASLGIFNLSGQLVRAADLVPGCHNFVWDGKDNAGRPCASGIYLIRLASPTCLSTAKLVLLK